MRIHTDICIYMCANSEDSNGPVVWFVYTMLWLCVCVHVY